jgi:hypothetical protein
LRSGRQQVGRRLDDHPGEITSAVDSHQLAWQDAGIQPPDFSDPQETFLDAGDHQADGIHVGRDQDGWPGLSSRAAF